MKKISLIFILFLIIAQFIAAQNDKKDTIKDSRFDSIIKMIDKGEYVYARTALNKALNNGADLFKYSFELARCNYKLTDYKDVVKVLEPLILEVSATSDFYQLLGNAYYEMGKIGKAVSTYNDGLKRFPNAGCLYLELGNIAYKQKNYKDALFYYEKGIDVQPDYPSNYYCATQIYLSSTEEVWAVMFGEIFMNLEKGTERSKDVSKQIFDVFCTEIILNRDEIAVDFYNPTILYSDSYERHNLFPDYYKQAMLKACNGERYLDLSSLIRIRKRFIAELYRTTKDFHNVVFDYHKTLIAKGYFDAYNYWLFSSASSAESAKWIKDNSKLYNEFLKWFEQNPLKITKENLFTRYNME
ncbi:MAG: tetratricopeptide repeat protein [Bacteroidales bacterium]|jgi:tetratricopeptide (TPR) repeat protein|nr:tetratricopeptide repeat protein [Bacteroidales bacterium]